MSHAAEVGTMPGLADTSQSFAVEVGRDAPRADLSAAHDMPDMSMFDADDRSVLARHDSVLADDVPKDLEGLANDSILDADFQEGLAYDQPR